MWYLARYMLHWYVLILIAKTNCCTKNVTQSLVHMYVTKQPQLRYNNVQKVYTEEEGRTSNMIITANCIEGIRCIVE